MSRSRKSVTRTILANVGPERPVGLTGCTREGPHMRYVGVDLAWGTRRPTGLAVLDTQGRLLHLSTMRTDEEILGALAPYVDGDCLVALDAPLIVTNPTGNRPCEAELNRDFARFHAGAH